MYESALSVGKDLKAIGGVDCVLISHADLHHIGALPLVILYFIIYNLLFNRFVVLLECLLL